MKKIITILLTVALFVASVALGVNSVYRVSEIALEINFVSEEAKIEAEELKKRLYEIYDERNVFDVGEEEAASAFEQFPYFRLTSFEKQLPNKLIIEATEDAETFAVFAGEDVGYYILALDGTILSVRDDSLNRSDASPNVLIEGVEIFGEKGEVCKGQKINALLPFLKEFSKNLNGLRGNVSKITYRSFGGNIDQYDFSMREGVTVMLQKANEFVEEKARKVTEKYLSLEDRELLGGYIYATNGSDKATVDYIAELLPSN